MKKLHWTVLTATALSFCCLAPATTTVPATPQAQARGPVCAIEVQQFCKDVRPGGGRIADCMQQHASQLSHSCHASLAATQARRKARRMRS